MAHQNYEKVKGWLESESIREMIKASLPSSMDTDAWINAALTHIGGEKDVLEAEPESTLGAVLEAATLGLRFEGPLGEAYLEARSSKYKDQGVWKWRKLTQLQVQYRGLMKLARRDPLVRKVEAIIVHENDSFEHRLGSDPFLHHTWDVRQQRGGMVAVYAALRYHDGFYDFGQPYSMDAIYRHRDRVLADKHIRVEKANDGSETFFKRWNENEPEKKLGPAQVRRIPWITYIEAMAQKTAVRWSAKFWDLNPDFDRAAALVSMAESGRNQELQDVIKKIIPSSVLDGSVSDPVAGSDSPVQAASLTRQGSLRDQMLRESGIGQGENEGPPPEGSEADENEPHVEPIPEDGVTPSEETAGEETGEPSAEEKAEAIRLEQEEAKRFEEEQARYLNEDDSPTEPTGAKKRGGRRGRQGQ